MANTSAVKRGEIWWADLGASVGSVQGGIRPIIVVGNDAGNKFAPIVICAPITSKTKRRLPTHVDIAKGEGNLPQDSTVLLEQLRTIDKSLLREKAGDVDMQAIDRAIVISLGLTSEICTQESICH